MYLFNHDPLWFALLQTPYCTKVKNKWEVNGVDRGTQGKAESITNEQRFLCVAQYLPMIPVNIRLHKGAVQ